MTTPSRRTLDDVNWVKSDNCIAKFAVGFAGHGFSGVASQEPHERRHHRALQVHGVDIEYASDMTDPLACERPRADGVWTDQVGRSLAVKTADCLPVLIACRQPKVAAAVHAGWRGLASGIILNAIRQLVARGAPVNDLQLAIGPAIGKDAFEVGPEVVDALAAPAAELGSEQVQAVASKGRADRWHVDLQLAAVWQALNEGLRSENLFVMRACTKTLETEWHSFRRQGKAMGSNWSWISLT